MNYCDTSSLWPKTYAKIPFTIMLSTLPNTELMHIIKNELVNKLVNPINYAGIQ